MLPFINYSIQVLYYLHWHTKVASYFQHLSS